MPAVLSDRVRVFATVSTIPRSASLLLRSAEADSFDLGEDWFGLLERSALPAQLASRYYVLMDGDAVRCMLPVLIGDARWVTGLTTFYSALFRPVLSPEAAPADLAALLRRAVADAGASAIRLDAMSAEHPSFAVTLAAMRQAGLVPYTYVSHGNWYLPAAGQSFDDYFASLSSRVRNTVSRREKRFLADGRGRTEVVVGGAADLAHLIEAWDRVYAASWKRPEPHPDFMPELIRLCARRGWLRIGVAYYDDQPIAAQLWIVNAGRAAIYKLAYDQAHAQLSAGSILTARLMRHVLDQDRVTEIDYLIGDDDYKKDWVSHRRERLGIVGYDWRRLNGIRGIVQQSLGQLWRRVGAGRSVPDRVDRSESPGA